ncbi:MAG: hypothetical protein LUI87_10985 [Lachnospiraceae bacterium]|nr:hypothetical protein [Lachnospiraceae bacterium]
MPLFMFISGFFSKDLEKSRSKGANILLEYLIVQILFVIYYIAMEGQSFSLLRWVSSGFSMWYLFVLGIIKIIFPDLVKMKHPIVFCAILSILAMTSSPDGSLEKAVVKLAANMIYFVLGYYTTNLQIAKIRSLSKWIYLLMFTAGVASFCLIIKCGAFKANFLRMMFLREKSIESLGYGNWGFLWYVYVLVISIWMGICIIGLVPKKKYFVSFVGKNTITIYIGQAFLYLFFKMALSEGYFFNSYMLNYVFAFCLSILCVLIFGNNTVANMFCLFVGKCKKLILK